MKKPVSPIVAGAKWIGGFATLLLHELSNQGWTDEQIYSIVAESKPEDQPIAEIVSGLKGRFPSQIYASDWIPSGYEVKADPVKLVQFTMRDLEWIPVLEDSETFIPGDSMCERAKAKRADFSLVEAKFIWEHRDDVPKNIEVIFAGTLLFDTADKRLKVCRMYYDKDQWFRGYHAIIFGWYGHQRLPRIKLS